MQKYINRSKRTLRSPILQSALLLVLFYLLFVEIIYKFIFIAVPESIIGLLIAFFGFFIITVAITRLLYPSGHIILNATISSEDSPLIIYLRQIIDKTVNSAKEEFKFRIIPYIIMIGVITIYPNSVISISLYYSIAIVSTLVWILMHKERIPIVLPSGVFFGILLANGMIIESLIIHIAYNNTLVTAGFLRWIFKTKYKGYFGHK